MHTCVHWDVVMSMLYKIPKMVGVFPDQRDDTNLFFSLLYMSTILVTVKKMGLVKQAKGDSDFF